MSDYIVGSPVSAYIEARGFRLVRKGLEDFTSDIPKVGGKTIYDIVFGWRNYLASQPEPHAEGEPYQTFTSAKQRAYVMRAIRTGELGFPYRRTGRYEWNWRIDRDRSILASDGVGYILYNNVEDMPSYSSDEARHYAMYVGGGVLAEELQAPIHMGRWNTVFDALEGMQRDISEDIEVAISTSARKAGM